MSNTDEIADNVFARWGLSARPTMTKEEASMALAISLGLGALFDENIQAERHWLAQPRKELRGTARTAVLQGRFRAVLDLVEKERHLR